MEDGGGWEEVPARKRRQRTPNKAPNDPPPPTPVFVPPPAERNRRGRIFPLDPRRVAGEREVDVRRVPQQVRAVEVRPHQPGRAGLASRVRGPDPTDSPVREGPGDRSVQRRRDAAPSVPRDRGRDARPVRVRRVQCGRRRLRAAVSGTEGSRDAPNPHGEGGGGTDGEEIRPSDADGGGGANRQGGKVEKFRIVENISTFQMANDIAKEYLDRAL